MTSLREFKQYIANEEERMYKTRHEFICSLIHQIINKYKTILTDKKEVVFKSILRELITTHKDKDCFILNKIEELKTLNDSINIIYDETTKNKNRFAFDYLTKRFSEVGLHLAPYRILDYKTYICKIIEPIPYKPTNDLKRFEFEFTEI